MTEIAEQTSIIRRKEKEVAYHKLKSMIDTEGVNLDEEFSEQFTI